MHRFVIFPLLLLGVAPVFGENPLVVVAAARTGRIEMFDAGLGPLGAINVNPLLESVSASPDGRRLYIAQESAPASGACCGLFALDLASQHMCFLAAPALFGTPSPEGRFVFTQGDQGVQIFDARTLAALPTMKASGAYSLQPSPDGRWLLGVTNSPKPSLDIFDLKSRTLARQIPVPEGPVTGAWAGDHFYVFSYSGRGRGNLWGVKPGDTEPPHFRRIQLPDIYSRCNEPALLMLAGSADKLFLAEGFGFKLDRRGACPDAPLGGILAIQPITGNVTSIAESVQVNRMAVAPDGHDLYVLEAGRRGRKGNTVLLHIDTRTGLVLHTMLLVPGEWNLALAHIPSALIPHGSMHAIAYCGR